MNTNTTITSAQNELEAKLTRWRNEQDAVNRRTTFEINVLKYTIQNYREENERLMKRNLWQRIWNVRN